MADDKPCADCGQHRGKGGARGLCKSCYYKRRRRGQLGEMPRRNHSFEEHLARIVPDEAGCWHWPGFVNGGGYGMTGRHKPAHVKSYEHHIGPVPRGHDVGHACHDRDSTCQDWRTCLHRRCINPAHLVAQTRSENLRSRPWGKTHCIRGHELSPENVYIIPTKGSRQCKKCIRIVSAERRARRRATVPAQRSADDQPISEQLTLDRRI